MIISLLYNVPFLNYWLSVATLGMQLAALALLGLFIARKWVPDLDDMANFVSRWGMWLALALSLGGIALTLYYSEVLGFSPCGLCWLQRVFLYPQAILFIMAIWKRDRRAADYSIGFSVFGLIAGAYQHYLQMGGIDLIPCPATAINASGITADCAQRFLFEFGYITFPLMGVSLFALLIVLMLFVRRGEVAR